MLIDVNCWLGFWPFQMFPQLTAPRLAKHLSAHGIARAFVSPVESVLSPDPHVPSRHLLGKLKAQPGMIPVPVLDPSLGNWRECLDEYVAEGHGQAVRIIPNYHRYELDAPCVEDLAEALSDRPQGILMIQMRVEDERHQYPLMKVPGVPADAAIAFAKRHPHLRILCLCPYLKEAERLVNETRNIRVDTAFIEHANTLKHALARIPGDRMLFGSHTPFLYTRASVMKLECAGIPQKAMNAVASKNASRLLKTPTTS